MVSHFIKNTNEQYSIVDDIIFKHYSKTEIYVKPVATILRLSKTGKIYHPNNNRTKEQQRIWSLASYYRNRKYDKAKALLQKRKAIAGITRYYIASMLSISVKELTEELYTHHAQALAFKRKVAKEHNISIQSLTTIIK